MTKMLMKFPPYIEKNLSEIIKNDRLHEKGLIITLFQSLIGIFTQNSMIKSLSSTDASLINMLPTQKTLQVKKKKTGCRQQHLIIGGGGVDHAHGVRV